MADLIIKRLPDSLDTDDVVNADLLIHYIASLEKLTWFPITYIYSTRDNSKFELFHRLQSLRHFEKIKAIFDVNTVNELQKKIANFQAADNNKNIIGYSGAFRRVSPLYHLIESDKIGTLR
jgi:hypothetical protein